ncbi:MAG: DNA-binding protein [Candidatus Nanohaloarchaea archaeon]
MNDIEDIKKEQMEEIQEQQEEEQGQKEQLKEAAKQHLTKDARSRLENVRAARPDQASSIEQQIARLGMTGRINGKIDDSELKQMLKKLNQKGSDYSIKHR